MTSDNPMGKPSDKLEHPTKHQWEGWGWDETRCKFCYVNLYDPERESTDYCEDIEWAREEKKAKTERRHVATEEAIRVARQVLTREQWELLGITVAPYRDRDYI